MRWEITCALLCFYGLLKEFRPTEPYLFDYQHQDLNFTHDQLTGQVYPLWTYSYLVALIPVFLLSDLLLYTPILLMESLSFVGVWSTLIWGVTLGSQQLGQILYGWATATEIAYFAYIYAKVDQEHFARVTSWTRAALQGGKFLAYFLSEAIILWKWGDYSTLNTISLTSLCLTFFVALALPAVSWRTAMQRVIEKRGEEPMVLPDSYGSYVRLRGRQMKTDLISTYSQWFQIKWSLWWALTTCGFFQIGNYIQSLWGAAGGGKYNGFASAATNLSATVLILLLSLVTIDWERWGELALAAIAIADMAILLVISKTGSIYVMYVGYLIYRTLYQIMITIAQYNLAKRLVAESYGLVFGLNTFVALVLQTILTLIVADKSGLGLPIRTQFVVYACYHAAIALIFISVVGFYAGKKALKLINVSGIYHTLFSV